MSLECTHVGPIFAVQFAATFNLSYFHPFKSIALQFYKLTHLTHENMYEYKLFFYVYVSEVDLCKYLKVKLNKIML